MDLYPILAKVQEIFTGERYSFNKPVPTVQCIAEKQQVRFGSTGVDSGPDCTKTEVIWMEDCNDGVTDCSGSPNTPSADCAPSGSINLTEKKISMDDNLCFEREFAVDDNDCNDAFTFEEKQALWLASSIQKIEEKMNLKAAQFLASNSRAPLTENVPASSEGVGATNGLVNWGLNSGDVTNGTDYWNNPDSEILTDIYMTAEMEDMANVYFITGRLLRKRWLRALQADPGCCDPVAQQMLTPGMPDMCYDFRALDKGYAPTLVDTAGDPLLSFYAVDPGSIAFWSANQFENDEPLSWGSNNDETVFRVASPRIVYNDGGTLRPVYYDVMRVPGCGRTAKGRYYHTWDYRISFNGGMQIGPRVCAGQGQPHEMNSSGILHFTTTGENPA